MKTKNEKSVWISIRMHGDDEEIKIFDSYDEIYGLYDYTEKIKISEKTYKKLISGDYFARRYGDTIRAYSN